MLTVLTLEEGSRLSWRKELTRFFQATGDYDPYSMPPCIILSEGDLFQKHIDIGNGKLVIGSRPFWNGIASVLPVLDGRMPGTAVEPGLFVSWKNEVHDYVFPQIATTIKGIALIETDGSSFRILRYRPLKRDRDL